MEATVFHLLITHISIMFRKYFISKGFTVNNIKKKKKKKGINGSVYDAFVD